MAGEEAQARPQDRSVAAPLLSLVVPAYNESDNIRRGVLSQIATFLSDRPYTSQVLVVDDGSVDDTADLVQQHVDRFPNVFSLLRNQHMGKAFAVRSGVMAADGEVILFADMDLSTPLAYVDEALAWLQEGYDVVIGSRFAEGAARLDDPPLRRVLGAMFPFLVRTLLLPGIHDSQCGFKGFRRAVARDLFSRMRVFAQPAEPVDQPRLGAFDVELLVLARRCGYSIKEMPVVWKHVPSRRVRPVAESLSMLREVLAIKANDLRGLYRSSASERGR